MNWYAWLVITPAARYWWGPKYLSGADVVREEHALRFGTFGSTLYRARWTGREWVYDTRPLTTLLASGY